MGSEVTTTPLGPQQATEPPLSENESDSGNDVLEDYGDESMAQTALAGATDCISRLLRLSMEGRSPLMRHGFLPPGLEQDPDVTSEMRNIVVISSSSVLAKRLNRANLQRRRQFHYWSQYRLKLETVAANMTEDAHSAISTMSNDVFEVAEREGAALPIPNAPGLSISSDTRRSTFECPYCFTTCSSYMLETDQWRFV